MSVRDVLREVCGLLFPPRCLVCGRFCRSPICAGCRESCEAIRPPLCSRCGRPFDPQAHSRPRCADCQSPRPPLTAARSFGLHVGPLRTAVNELKFRGRVRLAQPLGALLSTLLGDMDSPLRLPLTRAPSALVPVPLHAARRKERGFDQAELLAEALSQATGIPVRSGLLARTRYTDPQIGLSPPQRRKNVRGAFEARYPLPGRDVLVVLVDDVYTTGATLEECARTLRRAGTGSVCALTVSRAAPEWHPAADLDHALGGS